MLRSRVKHYPALSIRGKTLVRAYVEVFGNRSFLLIFSPLLISFTFEAT